MYFSSERTPRTTLILLIFLILAQFATAYIFSLTHLYEFKKSAIDGASFEQLLYNIINGRGIISTIPPPYVEQNWLGIHFSPIIYLIAPIYWLLPHIETLLFLQSFCIAIAAIPIFFTAKIFLPSYWLSLLIAVFYLINPFVVNAEIWDFHEIFLAPLTISLILWSVAAHKKYWLILFCLILLSIKEHYGLAVFGVGLLWAWHWQDKKFGLPLAAFGLASFVVVLLVIMPYFSVNGSAAMLNSNSEIDRFSWLTHPLQDTVLLKNALIAGSGYIALLFTPFLFIIPIFSLAWLFPLAADGLVNFISKNYMMLSPFSYHSAAIIPILLVAYTITLKKYFSAKTNIVLLATVIFNLAFSYSFVALPFMQNNVWEFTTPKLFLLENDRDSIKNISEIIGDNKIISAQSDILPILKPQRNENIFPNNIELADYIILHSDTKYIRKLYFYGSPYWSGADAAKKYFSAFNLLLNEKEFGVVYYSNNWILLKRGAFVQTILQSLAIEDLSRLEEYYNNLSTQEK